MNISGTWTYTEDFEYGNSVGKVELLQRGDEVTGIFSFTEEVQNNYKINVTEKVKGSINNDTLLLKSVEVKAIQKGKCIDYLPNTFEVIHISENKLVGSTYDTEEVCGVFVLERIEK